MPESSAKRWPLAIVGVFVCAVGAGVGALLGYGAGYLIYGSVRVFPPTHIPPPVEAGRGLGAVGGLLSGYVWCRLMQRSSRTFFAGRRRPAGLTWMGILWGVVAGVLAATVLHAGMMLATGRFSPDGVAIGLIVGVPAGALVGLLCGAVWVRVCMGLERPWADDACSVQDDVE